MPASRAAAQAMTLRALNPARSVVVEACAGSGKTWLLASRIVRLLLAGVAPGEILAITFTRKAAREIEERVVNWLHGLACDSDAQVAGFLAERGVAVDAATLRAARGLYEQVLTASPGLAVNTFHGWFLQLVDAAPLSANLAGATLVDTDSRLFDELWQSFAAGLQKTPAGEVTQGFVRLLRDVGLDSTRRLVRRALDRRSEWLAFADERGDGADDGDSNDAAAGILNSLRAQLGAGDAGQALAEFFASGRTPDFQAYLAFLEMSDLKGDQDGAARLRAALSGTDPETQFECLRAVLLTRENTPRVKNAGKTLDKRYTPDGAVRFLALHAELAECVLICLEAQRAERILAFNRDACTVFAAFLAHVEDFKRARRQIDFADAEWNVLNLLRDEQTAAFLQARLDARYAHVLLDEFQDTNPLQWQILLAWLDAYSDGARPLVFLVGDPKQSIYRFRRAEPRLFAVAADFLEHRFGADRCAQDSTWRNAQPIVDVVNALFLDVPAFAPFRAQSSFAGALPGRVELLPLCGNADSEEELLREGLRDPLTEPAFVLEDSRLRQEAAGLAAKIGEIVGSGGCAWQIEEMGADGRRMRSARYGDFMLLVRTRTHLAVYERALAAAGIPFAAGSRGGLLQALEVRDIVALLEFLVTPAADLKLAQVLRSPVFACGDDDLLQLAASTATGWWQRLLVLVERRSASLHLQRAARLLGEWLQAADRLPAHDLLDRIFHQGEVILRYRRTVPAAASAGVEANLRALLLLALDLDGGRYPSLPRFIDELHELRDLRDADANDAPDEGAIEVDDTQLTDAGRVRILTIHGAKGLEAPIVWLLGANAAPRAQDAWDVLVDWPPEAPSPQHYSFYGRREERGAARQPLFDREAAAAQREELNLLYVAITRARQVFFASGIESSRDSSATAYGLLAGALKNLGETLSHGDELLPRDSTPVVPDIDRSPASLSIDVPLPSIGERRPPVDAAERFGILLHALLERRTGGTEADTWWRTLGFDDHDYHRVLPVAERLLCSPQLQRFFDPARYRRAWNEVELTTGDGRVLRIDRLVEFVSEVWVVDYKSSGQQTARLAEYRRQIADYCIAVAKVFPRHSVRGGLVFSDATLLEVC